MTKSFEASGDQVLLGQAGRAFAGSDWIDLVGSTGEVHRSWIVSDLTRSASIETYEHDARLIAIGSEGCDIVGIDLSAMSCRILGRTERLDYQGTYDPGGMHHVSFLPLRGIDDIIVVTECSAARVDHDNGLRWKRTFDYLARGAWIDLDSGILRLPFFDRDAPISVETGQDAA